MYEHISGKIIELNPAYLVLETNNIGYLIHISLHTYSLLEKKEQAHIFLHQIVREDAQLLFGFAEKAEREIFRLLITVSGIGANTARLMLSSITASEIKSAIRTDNINTLKAIKGIGLKTAQRVIIDLKDKIDKTEIEEEQVSLPKNKFGIEASSALVMLGFPKNKAEKVINDLLSKEQKISVEELVKKALKIL
jgi:Holliday junction DNA helicase RuvA